MAETISGNAQALMRLLAETYAPGNQWYMLRLRLNNSRPLVFIYLWFAFVVAIIACATFDWSFFPFLPSSGGTAVTAVVGVLSVYVLVFGFLSFVGKSPGEWGLYAPIDFLDNYQWNYLLVSTMEYVREKNYRAEFKIAVLPCEDCGWPVVIVLLQTTEDHSTIPEYQKYGGKVLLVLGHDGQPLNMTFAVEL
jgi:hypothetical protein